MIRVVVVDDFFPSRFNISPRPHRLNLRERAAGSVFALRRPIDALLHTRVFSSVRASFRLPIRHRRVVASGDFALQSLLGRLPPLLLEVPHSHRGQGQIAISTFASAALKEGETRTKEGQGETEER